MLLIHPLVLGSGRHLFTDGGSFATFRLVDSKPTTTGVVIATYEPAKPMAAKAATKPAARSRQRPAEDGRNAGGVSRSKGGHETGGEGQRIADRLLVLVTSAHGDQVRANRSMNRPMNRT